MLVYLAAAAGHADPAANQGRIVRDASLGAGRGEIVPPDTDPLGQHADYLIRADLGEQHGGNLFHSFAEFGLATGEVATFTEQGQAPGAPAISNVITRVTGGSPSDIDGTIRSTIPGADLYLLNPAGLVFGPNARLDVPGSFHASTADRLEFDDAHPFEVKADGMVPLLEVARPEKFGFLSSNVAPIRLDSGRDSAALLHVQDSSSIELAGAHDVEIDTTAWVSGGRVSIASGRDLSVNGRVRADAFGAGNAGEVALSGARSVSIGDSGSINADAWGDGSGGSVSIASEGEVSVGSGTVSAEARGDGDAGRISIWARSLFSSKNSLRVNAYGAGRKGNVLINLKTEPSTPAPGFVERDGSVGGVPAGPVTPGTDDSPEPRYADYLIRADLGMQRGRNLFHSFSRFDLGPGEVATFTAQGQTPEDPPISHVISRVTGGTPSEIRGTLRSTILGADLYLLNPAGILFGPTAKLDVGGSFHAATADLLRFESGDAFEVRPDDPIPMLRDASPSAFGFLGIRPAEVLVEGAQLHVPTDTTLSIVAGDVSFSRADVAAPGGRIGIASVGSPGLGENRRTSL